MKIGYIRISTTDQNTARQEVMMQELGVDHVYIDRMSGKSLDKRDSPEDATANQILKEQIAQILTTLSEREQKIIRLRFGIGGGRPHTLEEVGNEFSVTRERIRQIEAKALSKLRKHKQTKKLHGYLK